MMLEKEKRLVRAVFWLLGITLLISFLAMPLIVMASGILILLKAKALDMITGGILFAIGAILYIVGLIVAFRKEKDKEEMVIG